ncbi:MAG: 30S ribosomal protein S6, partial [Thermodesulfobacteriota bacterium]
VEAVQAIRPMEPEKAAAIIADAKALVAEGGAAPAEPAPEAKAADSGEGDEPQEKPAAGDDAAGE